jgi:adenosylmethionine-8-amino-7-oxononanoate aminotransferase
MIERDGFDDRERWHSRVIDQQTTRVIYRDLHTAYPTVVRGEGIYLYDSDGNRYIDGSGGSAAVTAIGHGVEPVVQAIADQARRLAYGPTHAFSTEAIEECARVVVEEFAPPGLERVWFVSGGSEATENAIKIALQYQRDRGEGTRHIVIGRWGSFHGATLATLGVGGNASRRLKYSASIMPAEHIMPCHPYRCRANAKCPGCDLSCAKQLEYVIRQVGAENVAAFIAEPVVGATLGAVPATPGYFQEIREICDRYGILFIADEVMTGFGRTGAKFGIDHWGVVPDIIASAKGIAGGYAPLGAVITTPAIVGEVRRRGRSFVIGHTAAGNPLSCATGIAVMRYILDHGLIENARVVGDYFGECLRQLMDRHAFIGDIRGMGMMRGIELVADRETKEPFDPAWQVSRQVAKETFARGLVSYPLQGCADGVAGDHLLYTPPLTITAAQIDELVAILDESLAATMQWLQEEHA